MVRSVCAIALCGLLGASQAQAQYEAFICNSNIGGRVPQIGPIHHSSVAICPSNTPPTVNFGGRSYNNPACTYYGTRPGTSTFQIEPYRFDVTCRPSFAPASIVQQRIDTFNLPYNLFTNNCQHAATWATRK
jgi:hypothetical protein